MDIRGDRAIKHPVNEVWDALNDPDVLVKCIPGCSSLETVADSEYRIAIAVGMAAVKGTFKGTIKVLDRASRSSYRLLVEATGGLGFVRVEGTVALTPAGQTTTIHYSVDAHVGGAVAGVGQRVLLTYSRSQVETFFRRFEKELRSRQARPGARPT